MPAPCLAATNSLRPKYTLKLKTSFSRMATQHGLAKGSFTASWQLGWLEHTSTKTFIACPTESANWELTAEGSGALLNHELKYVVYKMMSAPNPAKNLSCRLCCTRPLTLFVAA